MKKIQKLVLICLAVATVLPACKKGDDDPFLSLRSRKSRVAGDWTMESKEEIRTDLLDNSSKITSINGSDYTYTTNDGGTTVSVKGTVGTNTFTFEKDGNWSSVYELTTITPSGSGALATTTTKVTHVESSGKWNFLGKIGDAKNKESISVSTMSETTKTTTTTVSNLLGTTTGSSTEMNTYGENENVEIWKLTELKNKEMKAEMTIDNTNVGTSISKEGGSIKMVFTQ